MAEHAPTLSPARRARLLAEFAALYLVVPTAVALALPPRWLFAALLAFTLLAFALLWRGGFDWRAALRGPLPWAGSAALGVAVLAGGLAFLTLAAPEARLAILRQHPGFLLVIAVAYPLLSALPQELIFRALFFHRYGVLLPKGEARFALNGAFFALAHLIYWSPLVLALTFAGGWLFARTYARRGLAAAWLLHAVAGDMIFAAGLGAWFYSGNVVRPF